MSEPPETFFIVSDVKTLPRTPESLMNVRDEKVSDEDGLSLDSTGTHANTNIVQERFLTV